MLMFIVRRLAFAVPTLIGAVTLIFLVLNVVPGDPVMLYLGDYYSGDAYHAMAARLGLDQPLHVRYFRYLTGLFRGDLGVSFRTDRPVLKDILAVFPFTAAMAVA